MNDTVLILAPHTDDGELGCGGTIARFLEEKKELYYVVFSTCHNSVPTGLPKDILEKEFIFATEKYGIERNHIFILDYPVREFNFHRQAILEDMIRIKNEINPNYVFAPSLHDIHQDHHVIAEEAIRAFKKTTLLAYEVPWNNLTFDNQVFIKLEEKHIRKKLEVISCYESQNMRPYMAKDFTKGQAKVNGIKVGFEFAEVFEAVRWIID